jgi:hypothetical protein
MTSLNIDEIRKLANNPLRVDMANVWCVMLQESLQWCLFEIDRLRQNQKTDFSIERCGKCGLTWD